MKTEIGNQLINSYLNKGIKFPDYAPNIVRANGWYHRSWDWLMPAIEKFENSGGNYHLQNAPGWFVCFVVYDDNQDRIFEYYSYHDNEPDKTKIERYWDGLTHYLNWCEIRKSKPDFVWSSRNPSMEPIENYV